MNLTVLRTVASAVVTGLAAVSTAYPQWVWLPGVIAAMAVLGVHAIPSIGQNVKGKTNDTGNDGAAVDGTRNTASR